MYVEQTPEKLRSGRVNSITCTFFGKGYAILPCQGSSQTSNARTFEESLLLHLIKLVEQSTTGDNSLREMF